MGARNEEAASRMIFDPYWATLAELEPLRERDPKAYAQAMHDSGRGHLLTQAERDLIER